MENEGAIGRMKFEGKLIKAKSFSGKPAMKVLFEHVIKYSSLYDPQQHLVTCLPRVSEDEK